MADRAMGVVYIAIGVGVAVGAGFALARSDWRTAFVGLFILGVGIVPIMLSRRHRYATYRRAKLSHSPPESN
jgi:predicted MFS family arabinose efflux permease